MYRETSRLLLFGAPKEDTILFSLADIFKDFRARTSDEASLIRRIYTQVKRILDLATTYGFDENLWQNYLTFLLVTNENSFTLTAERRGAGEGSVNHFAKNDFRIFRELFRFDFCQHFLDCCTVSGGLLCALSGQRSRRFRSFYKLFAHVVLPSNYCRHSLVVLLNITPVGVYLLAVCCGRLCGRLCHLNRFLYPCRSR